MINEETDQINELKMEKEKMLEKIKEYKNLEELNKEQIKALKEHIKEIEKKKNNKSINEYDVNDDAIEEYNNMRILFENEREKTKDLENKIHYKDEQIEGLKLVINKFADEREKILFKETKKNSNNQNVRYNNYDKDDDLIINNNNENLVDDLKEAKLLINKLMEEKKILEEENKKLKDNNKLIRSEYKSEGGIEIAKDVDEEEEYTIKKMVITSKLRNQSEDIKIDYPGLSNLKQKYEELEEKFRNLEEAVINLLNNLKSTSEIKPMIIDVCKALEIGDDMIKQIIKED